MNKTQALSHIINAMSLRAPQTKSLELFADYLASEAGAKVLARLKRENRGNLSNVESAISHRARALKKLKDVLKSYLKNKRSQNQERFTCEF